MKTRTFLILLALNLILIGLTAAFAPLEKTLGANVRVVYLHGVWVWAALAAFTAAGAAGVAGLALRRVNWQGASRALGRAGLIFWITYLPISMWAMQTSWNGLFLAEPRWRLALIFAVGGLLLQLGLTFFENPAWAAGWNAAFVLALFVALNSTENVMHPPSPILDSDAARIQLYFAALLALTLLAAGLTARWLYGMERPGLARRS
ncbi:MAG: hypothetical protein L0Z70_03010 [Chloroflexi bacterium]|nr:hypothetical protein [Chloroflexota bacterium]